MAATLTASFSSGLFTSQLAGAARLSGAEILQEVTSAELVSLEISQISYAHNRLVYYYDEEQAQVSSSSSTDTSLSLGMIMLFASIVGLGFLAFVGIVAHGFNGYHKLSTISDSEAHITEKNDSRRNPFGTDAALKEDSISI
jgi:hypothetical protein